MIYTITVNPSIDYVVQLPQMTLGSVNRLAHTAKLLAVKASMYRRF